MNIFILAIVGALSILVLLGLLRLIDIILREPVKGGPLAGRPEKTLRQFAEEAGQIQVSLRVAREAYGILTDRYPSPMSIDLDDELRRDLHLSNKDILELRSTLLQKTDRSASPTQDVSKIRTVRDLIVQTEGALRDQIDRAALRLRTTDSPYPVRPTVEVIEFKPTSQVLDPDYLRRAHFKWLRRRMADYKGLRSRASDNAPKTAHTGPLRRSHEGPRYPLRELATSLDARPRKIKKPVPEPAARPKAEAAVSEPLTSVINLSQPAIKISGPEFPSL